MVLYFGTFVNRYLELFKKSRSCTKNNKKDMKISDCSDSEADALIPIIRELLQFMRSNGKTHIDE